MTPSQILAVLLASVAAIGFFQSGRLLGVDGKGWREAPAWMIAGLDGLTAFWAAAAGFAVGNPQIASPGRLALALVFAIGALAVLSIVARRSSHNRWRSH